MNKISTLKDARKLVKALAKRHIRVKPETFDMYTSGVYIPRWLGYKNIPHHYEKETDTAHWYFFLRFHGKHTDLNVADALRYMAEHGFEALVKAIKNGTSIEY